MKCKFCFAELNEDVTVCPACGKDLTETEEIPVEEITEEIAEETEEIPEEKTVAETEEATEEDDDEYEEIVIRRKKKKKKKMPKALKVVLASIGGVVLAGALGVAVLYGMGYKFSSIGALIGLTEADVSFKSSYTVSDEKVEQKADQVIAQVGDQTLTNAQLQVYYWMSVRDYVDQYAYAIYLGQASELGFDPEKPLGEQVYDTETGRTYEQYFLENAIEIWRRYAILVQLAEDSGYVLTQELQDYLDTYSAEMDSLAVEAGYVDAEDLIDQRVSKGSSVDTYFDYICTEYTALGYLQSREGDMAPTEQELEDYYSANETEMTEAGYGKADGKYYNVRHIYITIEGDPEKDEDGNVLYDENGVKVYTDAQWEACLEKAQKLLDDFLADDPTEEKFAELAIEYSEDPGSASYGGLYSYLTENYGFIQEFEDWYVDESRNPGDTGLVKNTGSSSYGYHIMYFSSSKEIWKDQAETQVLAEKTAKLLYDATNQYPIDIDYKKVALGEAEISLDEYYS